MDNNSLCYLVAMLEVPIEQSIALRKLGLIFRVLGRNLLHGLD